MTGNPNGGPHDATEWFNTAAFLLPQAFTFGSAGRNDVIGPSFVDLDMSLQKDFALPVESSKLEFRFEHSTCSDHPNFNIPGADCHVQFGGTADFSHFRGVVTSAQDPRELQFALKWIF